jgi:hypothetical protein
VPAAPVGGAARSDEADRSDEPDEEVPESEDGRPDRRRLVPSSRTVASTLLGIALVAACYWLYQSAVQPPRPSTVRAEGTRVPTPPTAALPQHDPAATRQLNYRESL